MKIIQMVGDNLISISLIGTNESLGKIEIKKIGSFIAIDNRGKSWPHSLSSKNQVVSDNQRSHNRDLTVYKT